MDQHTNPPEYQKIRNEATTYGSVPAGQYQPTVGQYNQAGPYQQPDTIVVQPSSQVAYVSEVRPPSYMALSCFVYWCCNWVLGGIAFALSMASTSAADENRMAEAWSYAKAAKWTSIAGVLMGIATLILIIVLYTTVWSQPDTNDPYNGK